MKRRIIYYASLALMAVAVIIGAFFVGLGSLIKALGFLIWFEPKMAREEVKPFIKALKL